jgi:dTDP-4-amino-4,6-dideoxygalactose transaminase
MSKLALLGGTPVRSSFPEPKPRLSGEEAAALAATIAAREWSRAGDDWPLPCLDLLEEQWAQRHGAAHAVAVSSGTAGLTLVLQALSLHPGDEVLIPAYGCPAVDVAVLGAGLTPVHVEIDPRTYSLSPAAVAAAVTARTAALVAVHFAGAPAYLDSLNRIAERHGIALIEDACLAPGASYRERSTGAWGRAAVFSLGVRKPVSAGEGGLVTTNDPALADAVRRGRSLGADSETGDIRQPTGNYRLTELQAAVSLPQLRRLDADINRREQAAAEWMAALAGSEVFRPLEQPPGMTRHARAQFWIRYDEEAGGISRERIAEAVQAEGIPLFPGWPRPNYCLQCYTRSYAAEWLRRIDSGREPDHYERARCPHAERAAFDEALLLDFPLIDGEARVIADTAAALRKVEEHLADLRAAG